MKESPWSVPKTFVCLLVLACLVLAGRVVGGQAEGDSPAAGSTDTAQPETAASPGSEPSSSNAPDAPATGGSEVGGSATGGSAPVAASKPQVGKPLAILAVGIAIVLGLIILLKVNAFIALISAAMVVSLLSPGAISDKISRVATAFGGTAGGIGIVIALAAVIGKCMLDSGAADRIVRAFLRVLGEKRAPLALMGSGYVLAIPVFFDTVFYLLVPLARSLHQRTKKNYLMYILAIGAGGALTHSLVPPTPGPLLMASTLNVDLGLMILIGALVALPAALAGVLFAAVADRIMKTPMRTIGNEPEPEPLSDDRLPPLWLALAPVLLPVFMISINTGCTTYADLEPTARLTAEQVSDWDGLAAVLRAGNAAESANPAKRLYDVLPAESQQLIAAGGSLTGEQQAKLVEGVNLVIREKTAGMKQGLYDEDSHLGVRFDKETKGLLANDRTRMRQAIKEHINRLVIEQSLFNGEQQPLIAKHQWLTPRRKAAEWSDLIGNANLALLISTLIALATLVRQRGYSRDEVAKVVETSLMSGGVIILITSGGGAFGKMLEYAEIRQAIETLFQFDAGSGASRLTYLLLGFGIAAVLKVAQGSGTVAMIVGSSMMAAIVGPGQLDCHPVYLATAVGAGSLVGSWMNDSGFWIFAKMGGLTEAEGLKSWTLMLVFLGVVSLLTTLLLATVMPMVPN